MSAGEDLALVTVVVVRRVSAVGPAEAGNGEVVVTDRARRPDVLRGW